MCVVSDLRTRNCIVYRREVPAPPRSRPRPPSGRETGGYKHNTEVLDQKVKQHT